MRSLTTTSADGTRLATYRWPAAAAASAIILIIHGLAEHGRRYNHFAERLAAHGVDVYSFDLRGHGATTERVDHGHLGTHSHWQTLLDDVAAIRTQAMQESGYLPVILLGHSLGSFIAQGVLQNHGRDYAGAVLLGAATPSRIMCVLGRFVASVESARVDPTGHSMLMRRLTFGAFEKALKRRIGSKRTHFDWLSSLPAAVDDYIADKDTGFDLRTATWQRLLPGIARVQSPRARMQIPQTLPLLIAAGEDDPVGGFGREPQKLAAAYTNGGHSDVTTLIYAGARHELLHDRVADHLHHDLLDWLTTRRLAGQTPPVTLKKTT